MRTRSEYLRLIREESKLDIPVRSTWWHRLLAFTRHRLKFVWILFLLAPLAGAQLFPRPTPREKQFDAKADVICKRAKRAMSALAKQYPGIASEVSCGRFMTSNGGPTKFYPLTSEETRHLEAIREKSAAIWKDEDDYERKLLEDHGHPQLEFANRCWHYIGIRLHDHFITETFGDPSEAKRLGCPTAQD